MFNRVLEMKMVKKDKKTTPPVNQFDVTLEGKTAIIADAADRIVKKVTIGAVAYVALDTARQVLVALARK